MGVKEGEGGGGGDWEQKGRGNVFWGEGGEKSDT